MMNAVMKRPMFRQKGSPMTGENSSEQAFMQYLQANLSPEQLQSLMQNPDREQIIGQLYQKFMSEQQAPSSPMVMRQEGSPMNGEKKIDPYFGGGTGIDLLRKFFTQFMSAPGEVKLNELRDKAFNFYYNQILEEAEYPGPDQLQSARDQANTLAEQTVQTYLSNFKEPAEDPILKYRDRFSEDDEYGFPSNVLRKEERFSRELLEDPKFFGPDSMLDMRDFNKVRFGPDAPTNQYLMSLPQETRNAVMKKFISQDAQFDIQDAERAAIAQLNRRGLNMAEGGPVEEDAVGIASGLDEETTPGDPSRDGIAKVSPEQYVQLMNDVRGDEVPLEGRVQELAMTVGEKDAKDTPLSVLTLVQPVFELQEQQGIAQAPGADQMMAQAQVQPQMAMGAQGPVTMNQGGIVHLAEGPDERGIYSGMNVGPFSLEQIKNFGLYTKPDMKDLGVASYAAGAGDFATSNSPEAIIAQMSNLTTTPKTFAEILQEKKDMVSKLGLYDSSKKALKLPFYSGLTKFGLDIARGENVADAALQRFNEATNVALPSALQIQQQESQLPLTLSMSEYSSQKKTADEMNKFILGKAFDLAMEREKSGGVGAVGVVGQNDDAINKTFGFDVTSSLPAGTIVQKNTAGVLTTIKPDDFNVKDLITVEGTYVDGNKNTVNVKTVIDISTESGKAEFERLKEFSEKAASELRFSPFISTQPSMNFNIENVIPQGATGGEVIVKRSTGTGPEGEQSLEQKYPDIMTNEAFLDLEINPLLPGPGKIDITKLSSGTDKILGIRFNTGDEAKLAIEDLVRRTYIQPETVGILGGFLRGLGNVTNTADELLTQLTGVGLPEEMVYNNPELQKTLEDMMKIPKLVAEAEAGPSRYRATNDQIEAIAKDRLDYGLISSASNIRKSLMAVHKTVHDKMNTYRTSLGLPALDYEVPKIFDESYGKTLAPKSSMDLPNISNFQSKLLEAVPGVDLKKYPELLTDPIFTTAIYSLSQGATMEDVGPKFLELFNQKYGTKKE